MRLRHLRPTKLWLFPDSEGEARFWSHWQNFSAEKEPGAWPKSGRWWLHMPGNCMGVEWHLGKRDFGAYLQVADAVHGNDELKLHLAIPFLISLYLSLANANWLVKLLGLTYYRDQPNRDWSRELKIAWHHGALWITPWVNDESWEKGKWRKTFQINPANILLGRMRYSRTEGDTISTYVVMPEGAYPATVNIYTAQWKRKRWPWPKEIQMADIDVTGGIPIPGKGENGWDMDDDAIFSMTTAAQTSQEATEKYRQSVMRDRVKYAAANWKPDAGWPRHLLT